VPPELRSYRFQPRQVIASDAEIPDIAFRFVHEPCGEFAAAKLTVTREEKGASDPDIEVGEPVAHCTQRPAGCVAAAAPVVQSRSCLAMYESRGIHYVHDCPMRIGVEIDVP
jgi:hypothetical protein